MCVWNHKGEGLSLSDVNKGHRSKPRQDQSNHLDVTSVDKEGCAKAHWLHSIAESIHIEACRMKFTLFHHTEGLYKSRMGALQQKAFDDLKKYLKQLPILSSLEQGQPLILYVSTTHTAVSGALVVEKEVNSNGKTAKQQFSMYFMLEVLTGSKRFYSKVEKICSAVIMSAHKLRHYFKAHTIKVLTNQPLNGIFGNRDSSGRISKWAIELSEHVVDFEKHSVIKSHILADFVVEWTKPVSVSEGEIPDAAWLRYCDEAWCAVGAGAATILISPSGIKLCYAAILQFTSEANKCTNNITEYEAILLGLCQLRAIGIQRCILHTDSKVVVGQIEKECIASEPT
jgi:hypothetical protein